MFKNTFGSTRQVVHGKESGRSRKLKSLFAMTVWGCLSVAMSQQAFADDKAAGAPEAQGGDASQEQWLDDLMKTTESPAENAPASEGATPSAQSGTPPAETQAEPTQAEAGKSDDAIPVVKIEPDVAPASAAKAPAQHAQIEEIVVTATKREESIREIPASISAVSGEELAQRGAQDAADIVKLVPGVNLTSTGDSPARITIRGISSDIGTSSTTGVLFGNVSFSDSYAPILALDPNPFDMASVEVLKGPQGTLFGASALNGAVRYVPTTPRFGEYELKWFGQYTWIHEGGSAPTYGAAVNVPLYEDKLALRVMAFDRTAPGFIDNTRINVKDTNKTKQEGARALLGWRPSEAWDILLTSAWQQTKLKDVGIADNDQGNLVVADRPRVSPNTTKYWMQDLSVTYNGDWAQFVSDTNYIYKYGNNFFDGTSRTVGRNPPVSLIAQYYHGNSETYGQEFRLVSNDSPEKRWKWVAGVFGWQQDLKSILTVPLAVDVTPIATIIDTLNLTPLSSLVSANGPVVLQTAADVRVREFAAFGDLTRRLGESVEVALGGRFYRTSSGGQNVQSGVYVLAQQGSSPYVLEGEDNEHGFNPKASVLWHVNDDIIAYGLFSKGFRVGGIQTGLTSSLTPSSSPKVFKSDTLLNYEAGLRTQFFDNTLRVDLTGFWVDWKNPQSLQPDASGLSVYITNVGGVRSRGGDLSVQYLFPWEGLMVSSAISYAKTVTTTPFTTATGDVYAAGTMWPLAPKVQTTSNLSYMRPFGDWILGGLATYSTIGSATPIFGGHKIFGYQQLDLQVSASSDKYKWLPQIALIVNNVMDERGLTNAFTSGIPTPELAAQEYYYITPRAITLRLMGRFGD